MLRFLNVGRVWDDMGVPGQLLVPSILPKYEPPMEVHAGEVTSKRDPCTYFEYVKVYNSHFQEEVQRVLAQAHFHQRGYALIATGSDGRFEKGPQSTLEVILLVGDQRDKDLQKTITGFRGFVRRKMYKDVFTPHVEVKNIATDVLSYYTNDPAVVYPTRLSDAVFLFGNRAIYKRAMRALVREFKETDPGERILDKTRVKRRKNRGIMLSGTGNWQGEPVMHYDLEHGIAYYDSKQKVGGFKYGPLRFVQFAMITDMISYIRKTGDGTILWDPETNRGSSTNIVNKLNRLAIRGVSRLSQTEVDAVAEHYKYFLWQFHHAQHQFKMYGQGTTYFDASEAKRRIGELNTILSNSVLKLPDTSVTVPIEFVRTGAQTVSFLRPPKAR